MSIFYEMDKDFGDLLKEKKNFLYRRGWKR